MSLQRTFYIGCILAVVGVESMTACDRSAPPKSAPSVAKTCTKHGLAMAQCPFCNPAIIKEQGECAEHGVPEALCSQCRPFLVAAFKKENDWCGEHSVPESQCVKCNPGLLKKATVSSAALPPKKIELIAAPDEKPRSNRTPSVTCKNHTLRIRFSTPDVVKQAGLEFAKVERRPLTATLTCNALVAYDGNHYARVTPRAPGLVREVAKDLGDTVAAGDALAVIESAELSSATAEYLQAAAKLSLWEKHHQRTHELVKQGISAAKEDLETEARLEESRLSLATMKQKVKSLGLKDDEVDALPQQNQAYGLLAMRAPFAGVVVERSAVIGEAVDTQKPLFAVADTSRMWSLLDVYEDDLSLIQRGQRIVLTVGGVRGESFAGTITWISTQLDSRTRTLKARAEIDNPDGRLRANMFGQAIVKVHQGEERVVVPKSAVQWDGCCNLVFIRKSDQLFVPRPLRLGYATDDAYEVLEGVEPGEVIVTQGSFLLKTELLKGSIGAGCCEAGEKKS
jgi:cobalt-zinc-cadmium efflux system membrane fusion protein